MATNSEDTIPSTSDDLAKAIAEIERQLGDTTLALSSSQKKKLKIRLKKLKNQQLDQSSGIFSTLAQTTLSAPSSTSTGVKLASQPGIRAEHSQMGTASTASAAALSPYQSLVIPNTHNPSTEEILEKYRKGQLQLGGHDELENSSIYYNASEDNIGREDDDGDLATITLRGKGADGEAVDSDGDAYSEDSQEEREREKEKSRKHQAPASARSSAPSSMSLGSFSMEGMKGTDRFSTRTSTSVPSSDGTSRITTETSLPLSTELSGSPARTGAGLSAGAASFVPSASMQSTSRQGQTTTIPQLQSPPRAEGSSSASSLLAHPGPATKPADFNAETARIKHLKGLSPDRQSAHLLRLSEVQHQLEDFVHVSPAAQKAFVQELFQPEDKQGFRNLIAAAKRSPNKYASLLTIAVPLELSITQYSQTDARELQGINQVQAQFQSLNLDADTKTQTEAGFYSQQARYPQYLSAAPATSTGTSQPAPVLFGQQARGPSQSPSAFSYPAGNQASHSMPAAAPQVVPTTVPIRPPHGGSVGRGPRTNSSQW